MYLINLETDGDGYYHAHTRTCTYRPRTNYKNLISSNLTDAINEARKIVNSNRVRGCKHCCG